MSLSSDLISQFVKITNDNKDPKRETTTYGTIVKNGSSTYVKLDGSDLNTPVVSTAFVDDGDRVTVMIKNHTAIVTGNVSSPSAKNSDISKINNNILLWSHNEDKTHIDGSKIYAGSITTSQLATDSIKSLNYKAGVSGSFLNLSDGSFDSKYLKWNEEGNLTATSGAIGGIAISDGKLSSMSVDSNNIPTGFELRSDGSFVSKGSDNPDYVYDLKVKSGAIYCSSFHGHNNSFRSGITLNANGIYFKEGDSSGETSGSIIRGRSAGGFDFYFSEGGMRLVFKEGEIWRVDTSGTWTKIAG